MVLTRRMTLNTEAPPLYSLEINEFGIKMLDKTKVMFRLTAFEIFCINLKLSYPL